MKRLTTIDRLSKGIVLVGSFSTNLAALGMPLVARQILTRGAQSGNVGTVAALAGIVLFSTLVEVVGKYCRSMIFALCDRDFMTHRLHWLIDRVVRARTLHFRSSAAASVDYTVALQQVKSIADGELDLIWAELAFVPVIVAFLFVLSPACALAAIAVLALLVVRTWHAAHRFSDVAERSRGSIERRFEMLFIILERMHAVKALSVEQRMTRVYEQAHGAAMQDNLRLAEASTRLSHTGAIMGMLLNIVLLLTCALSSGAGAINVSLVVTIVLLASRLMDPIHRAVFLFQQGRDRAAAFEKIRQLDEDTVYDAPRLPEGTFETLQEVRLDGLMVPGVAPLHLTIGQGQCVAITGNDTAAIAAIMAALAGHGASDSEGDAPSAAVLVNGEPLSDYACADRNRIVGYVGPDMPLFDGNIEDNITRFGEVTVEQASEVAALLDIQTRLDTLPGGLLTPVGNADAGAIPPGLERQIAILRSLSHKPRMILFDRAELGLDREAYGSLIRFIARLSGQATIVIASEDANLTSLADRTFVLSAGGLALQRAEAVAALPYRTLVI